MADLQCLETIKNRTRAPSQTCIEAADQGEVTLPRKQKRERSVKIKCMKLRLLLKMDLGFKYTTQAMTPSMMSGS